MVFVSILKQNVVANVPERLKVQSLPSGLYLKTEQPQLVALQFIFNFTGGTMVACAQNETNKNIMTSLLKQISQ